MQLRIPARSITAVREIVVFIMPPLFECTAGLLGSVISNRDNVVEGKSQQRFGEWTRQGSNFLVSGPMCFVLAE